MYSHGDLKKIASCRVKPFELVERNNESALELEEEKLKKDVSAELFTELKNDKVGASYLKKAQFVSF